MTNHWVDLQNCKTILVEGSNVAENHPMAFKWIRKAQENGATIIHIDPRYTRTSAAADVYARIRPGTDVAFQNAMISHIIVNKLYDEDYVVTHTNALYLGDKAFSFKDGVFSGYDEERHTYAGTPTTRRVASVVARRCMRPRRGFESVPLNASRPGPTRSRSCRARPAASASCSRRSTGGPATTSSPARRSSRATCWARSPSGAGASRRGSCRRPAAGTHTTCSSALSTAAPGSSSPARSASAPASASTSRRVAAAAHAAGALVLVDATQAFGVVPVSLAPADVLVASTFKWALAVHGAAVFAVADSAGDLEPAMVGWRGVRDLFAPDRFERYEPWPDARRFDEGMPAFGAEYVLEATLDLLDEVGPDAIEASGRGARRAPPRGTRRARDRDTGLRGSGRARRHHRVRDAGP